MTIPYLPITPEPPAEDSQRYVRDTQVGDILRYHLDDELFLRTDAKVLDAKGGLNLGATVSLESGSRFNASSLDTKVEILGNIRGAR